jgi:hypothetical protein
VYLGHPIPVGYKFGDLALQVGGVSRIGTIKYGLESRRAQTRAGLRWRGPAVTVNYRPVLLSERELNTNPKLSKEYFKKKEKCVAGPRWVPYTRTDCRLIVGRKITSTSSQTCPAVQMGNVDVPLDTEMKYLSMHLDRRLAV